MCIAIVKPQGTEISDEYLENCFHNNKKINKGCD